MLLIFPDSERSLISLESLEKMDIFEKTPLPQKTPFFSILTQEVKLSFTVICKKKQEEDTYQKMPPLKKWEKSIASLPPTLKESFRGNAYDAFAPRKHGTKNQPKLFLHNVFLGDRYDWTTGEPRDGNEWKKCRVVPRAHTSRTLLYAYFKRSGSKGPFSFPGATWDRFHCTVEPSPGHIRVRFSDPGTSQPKSRDIPAIPCLKQEMGVT